MDAYQQISGNRSAAAALPLLRSTHNLDIYYSFSVIIWNKLIDRYLTMHAMYGQELCVGALYWSEEKYIKFSYNIYT